MKTNIDRPARKARPVLGGSGVLLDGRPLDLSSPRASTAYALARAYILQLETFQIGESVELASGRKEREAAAAVASREAYPVNTGITSNVTHR